MVVVAVALTERSEPDEVAVERGVVEWLDGAPAKPA